MKILYAAQNCINSGIQLSRFIKAIEDKPYKIKIAAYKNSTPIDIQVNWTLDCLLDIINPNHLLRNNYYSIYFDQIKEFSPDLIISDSEYFTSEIAADLNIPLWQCSSSLLNFALINSYKYNLGINKKYSYISIRNQSAVQKLINMIENSEYNFIYSHFGDTDKPPPIKSNFHWIRPYHDIGKISAPCAHPAIGITLRSNKYLIDALKRYDDSVLFYNFIDLNGKLIVKNINNYEEYYCNLKNSFLFACSGETSFLADAFYNEKFAHIFEDPTDIECVVNAAISEKQKTGVIMSPDKYFLNNSIKYELNDDIKYLHEKIELL